VFFNEFPNVEKQLKVGVMLLREMKYVKPETFVLWFYSKKLIHLPK